MMKKQMLGLSSIFLTSCIGLVGFAIGVRGICVKTLRDSGQPAILEIWNLNLNSEEGGIVQVAPAKCSAIEWSFSHGLFGETRATCEEKLAEALTIARVGLTELRSWETATAEIMHSGGASLSVIVKVGSGVIVGGKYVSEASMAVLSAIAILFFSALACLSIAATRRNEPAS